MATELSSLPNVQLSYGPMLIGVFFNMILYGVLIGQVLTYYQLYSRDASWMRIFVAFLFVIETANTALNISIMYQPLILEYGQKPVFFPTVFMTQPLCVVLISTPIQLFFAWRIHQLTKSPWVSSIIGVFAAASFAGGVWTAAMVQLLRQFVKKPLLHNPALLWFWSSCVADVLITVSLVITLSKKKTGFVATDSVVDKIIQTTIQTGMITALFSILDVVCFLVLPHYAVNFVWDIALSKLYTNCLLSTLNARQALNAASFGHGSSLQRHQHQQRNVMLSPATGGTSMKHAGAVDGDVYVRSEGLAALSLQSQDLEQGLGYGFGIGIRMTKIVERVEDPLPGRPPVHFLVPTLMSALFEPSFPPELEREIFETTAGLHPEMIPTLLQVAQRIHDWLEPILYERLDFGGFRNNRKAQDSLSAVISAGGDRASSVARGVRHITVYLPTEDDLQRIQLALTPCSSITRLAVLQDLNSELPILQTLLPAMSTMNLRRLACGVSADFLAKASAFRFLSHFDLCDEVIRPEATSFLLALPRLTHLALNIDSPDRDALRPLLNGCVCLEVVALLFYFREQDDDASVEATAVAVASELDDLRLVVTQYSEWDECIRDDGYWFTADKFLKLKSAGKIPRTAFSTLNWSNTTASASATPLPGGPLFGSTARTPSCPRSHISAIRADPHFHLLELTVRLHEARLVTPLHRVVATLVGRVGHCESRRSDYRGSAPRFTVTIRRQYSRWFLNLVSVSWTFIPLSLFPSTSTTLSVPEPLMRFTTMHVLALGAATLVSGLSIEERAPEPQLEARVDIPVVTCQGYDKSEGTYDNGGIHYYAGCAMVTQSCIALNGTSIWSHAQCVAAAMCQGTYGVITLNQCQNPNVLPATQIPNLSGTIWANIVGSCNDDGCPMTQQNFIDFVYGAMSAANVTGDQWPGVKFKSRARAVKKWKQAVETRNGMRPRNRSNRAPSFRLRSSGMRNQKSSKKRLCLTVLESGAFASAGSTPAGYKATADASSTVLRPAATDRRKALRTSAPLMLTPGSWLGWSTVRFRETMKRAKMRLSRRSILESLKPNRIPVVQHTRNGGLWGL
uniref:DUF6534 domain-containing protein n=1 Tax=Mycena chlorophos TaxID=658473 RepID=A0ABQ0M1U2_MYCCL|nr:predicted protein [Mycena chlorophos]